MPTQDTPSRHRVTRILDGAAGLTREQVLERLAPVVYDELRTLAAAHLRRERPDHSLQPTALVHEAYLRLVGGEHAPWEDRGHFFRAAARAMRRILIEQARRRGRQKRGGGRVRVSLDVPLASTWDDPDRMLALDEALRRLEGQDPRSAEVVQLRYFGGLSVRETAEALGTSERTVKREWTFARAWLRNALGEGGA
jgi:RNA polymerase sigma factor (TIGR02999 family)